jgi:hypothetical protein
VSTTEVIRNVRPDVGGLEERSERLLEDVKKRAEATRDDVRKRTEATRDDVVKRTEATREQLADLAGELGEDLSDRAVAAREALIERYHELEEELPTEEIATKAQLTAWKALQNGLSGLLVLPGLAVRGLGGLSRLADDLSERGAEVSERGRELVAAVPPSKAERRRAQRRTAGVAAGGFLVGVVVGWLLAGRNQTVVTYEPTMPQQFDQVADPAHPEEPGSPAVTSEAEVVDVRSEVERPEPGRDT